ncbi:MAG: polysaccharide biosynthesis tyrosine autokinase [Cytophagales bacterium]|nr:polysaccharide biosynthesis tyrosine autokinase [Cytophagales bacterium]
MSAFNGRSMDFPESVSSPTNQEEEEDLLSGIDIIKLLSIVRRNIIWILLIPVLCLLGGYMYLRYTSPVYESSSSIKLEIKQKANMLGINDPSADGMANMSGEIELIRSKLIYDEVISRMDLGVSYFAYGRSRIKNEERFLNAPFRVEAVRLTPAAYDKPIDLTIQDGSQFVLAYTEDGKELSLTGTFGRPVKARDFELVVRKTAFYNPQASHAAYYFVINSIDALNNYLATNLRVDVLNPSANIIGVFFKDKNVRKAHDIVNKIDSVYLHKTKELKNKANKQKIAFLEEQLQRTEDKLQEHESQLESLVVKNKTTDVEADVSKYAAKIDELLKARSDLTIQLGLLNRLQGLINHKDDLSSFIPSIPLLPDPQLQTYTNDINRLQQERTMLATTTRETTFAFQTKEKQVRLARESASALINQNKRLLMDKAGQIEAQLRKLESAFATLPAKGTEYTRVKRFKDLTEKYYTLMLDKKAELGIAEAGTVEEFVVLSPANMPTVPIAPNRLSVYAGCAMAGLFISMLMIGTRYFMQDTIANQRELERATTAPILGIIPAYVREKMSVSKLVVHRNPKASISEALRSIRTNLEFMFPNSQRKKIIAVTSTISGEGKTFVAINLGGVIALSGAKVVILDLDMRRPKVHTAFDEENYNGLSTLLIGKHTLSECIRSSPIETLDFIAAGPTPPNPSELILRPEFDNLLKELQQKYDVIVIDTPPIGLVTDGVLVMRKADLPIYVVRAEYSKLVFIKNINKLIRNNNFSKLAVILNAMRNTVQFGYGYGYGYGYGGSYYEDEEETKGKGIEKLKGLLSKIK